MKPAPLILAALVLASLFLTAGLFTSAILGMFPTTSTRPAKLRALTLPRNTGTTSDQSCSIQTAIPMKLIRHGAPGREIPGLLRNDGRRIDASSFGSDCDEAFFNGNGLERLAEWAKVNAALAPVVAPDVRLGPCIARPSKIVCVGLNYPDPGTQRQTARAFA